MSDADAAAAAGGGAAAGCLTPDQRDALAHWSEFGRPGEPAAERWVPTEGERAKLHPIASPESAPFSVDFTAEQTAVLLRGVGWREMEDKWVVWSELVADDLARVHLNRSWTGNETIVAEVELRPGGSSRVTRLTWESDPERLRPAPDARTWAENTFLEVCRWTLAMP